MARVLACLTIFVLAAVLAISLVHWSRACLAMEDSPSPVVNGLSEPDLRYNVADNYSHELQRAVGVLGTFFGAIAGLVAAAALCGAIISIPWPRRRPRPSAAARSVRKQGWIYAGGLRRNGRERLIMRAQGKGVSLDSACD